MNRLSVVVGKSTCSGLARGLQQGGRVNTAAVLGSASLKFRRSDMFAKRAYSVTPRLFSAQFETKLQTQVATSLTSPKITVRSFASLPAHTKLEMPALSPSMTKGNIVSWAKKEGDSIKPGDLLCEIETDKSVMAFEASDEGFLAKILLGDGTKGVPIGKEIAIVVESKDDVAKFKDYKPEAGAAAAPAPKASPPAPAAASAAPATPATPATPAKTAAPAAPAPAAPAASAGGRVFVTPAARAVAAASGVDLSTVVGTGPNNRILKADVLEAKASGASKPAARAASIPAATPIPAAAGVSFTDIPNSNIRKVIAERLTTSKQTIPHYYLTMEVNVDALLKLRTDLNNKAQAGEYKLSVNDFVVKASAAALRKVPEANSAWNDESIRRYHTVDINVAVNTDQGLFTPLIANADQKGLAGIALKVKEAAEKAKAGKLTPDDMRSGTFTISNLGMFGITEFAAVINPPQACILAVGASSKKVVAKGVNEKNEPVFGVENVMNVTLSCDHRVVDGAVGAKWLQVFKSYIEDPLKLLL